MRLFAEPTIEVQKFVVEDVVTIEWGSTVLPDDMLPPAPL